MVAQKTNRLRQVSILLGACLLLGLSTCASGAFLLSQLRRLDIGLRSYMPISAFQHAQATRQNGELLRSVPEYGRALRLLVDSSLRWTIADLYLDRSDSLRSSGQLQGAYQTCATAVQVIGDFDLEVGLSIECQAIRAQMEQNPPPSGPG